MPKNLNALRGVIPPVVTPLNADYTVDWGTFSFTGNYQHQRDLINTDTDGLNVDFFSSTRFQSYETYQFEGHFVSDFSKVVDMIAGVFYLYDSYHLGGLCPVRGAHHRLGEHRRRCPLFVGEEVQHLRDPEQLGPQPGPRPEVRLVAVPDQLQRPELLADRHPRYGERSLLRLLG